MSILFWALTIGVIGKVMLAAGVIMAHSSLAHEHQVDQVVIRTFQKEQIITLVGITLIIIGYFMEILFYGYTPLLSCGLEECGAALNAAFFNAQ